MSDKMREAFVRSSNSEIPKSTDLEWFLAGWQAALQTRQELEPVAWTNEHTLKALREDRVGYGHTVASKSLAGNFPIPLFTNLPCAASLSEEDLDLWASNLKHVDLTSMRNIIIDVLNAAPHTTKASNETD